MRTDATTAEMVKVMENTFRDVNVALANEFALIAERIGVDVWEAIRLANHHPRVNVLRPGPGVGGHCIAVDPWFLVGAAPDVARADSRGARTVNDAMPEHVDRRAWRAMLAATRAGGAPGRHLQGRSGRHPRESRAARGRAGGRARLRGAFVRPARATRDARAARAAARPASRRCATPRRSCCWSTTARSRSWTWTSPRVW